MANGSYIDGKFVPSRITFVDKSVRKAHSVLDLAASMQRREVVHVGKITGIVNMIEAEDGSGNNFNIEFVGGAKCFVHFD